MIVRLFILLALLLGTLPAPAAAAPPCHDAGEMAVPGMAMDTPASPAPDRSEKAPAMVKALCVGCIAPTTMKPTALTAPTLADARHAAPAPIRPLTGAALPPEPPPPRG